MDLKRTRPLWKELMVWPRWEWLIDNNDFVFQNLSKSFTDTNRVNLLVTVSSSVTKKVSKIKLNNILRKCCKSIRTTTNRITKLPVEICYTLEHCLTDYSIKSQPVWVIYCSNWHRREDLTLSAPHSSEPA